MPQANEPITSIKLVVFNQFVNQSKEKTAIDLIYEYEEIMSMPIAAELSKGVRYLEWKDAMNQFVKDYPQRISK